MDSSVNTVERKKFRTLAIYLSFFVLGVCAGLFGPALLDFQIMLNTDTQRISIGISFHAFGYLVGSFLCSVLYDRVSNEFWFAVANLGIGATIAAVPASPNLGLFIFFNTLSGIFMGAVDSGGQSYIVYVWKGSKLVKPLLQTAHAVWSLGAAIGPFIAKPFLLKELPKDINAYEIGDNTTSETVTKGFNASNEDIRVHYAGIIAGIIAVPSILMFTILFFLLKSTIFTKATSTVDDPSNRECNKNIKMLNKKKRIAFLVILVMFYFWLLVTEDTPGHFLATFVIKGLHWDKSDGPLITSVLWGAHSVGRFLAVPISIFLRPKTMIIITTVLTFLSMLTSAILCKYHPMVMWISTAVFGLGMSSTYASVVLRASEVIEMNGIAAGILSIGSSLGNIIGPSVVGVLFDSVSPFSVLYASLLGALMCILMYIVFEVMVRYFEKSKTLATPNVEKILIEEPQNKATEDPNETNSILLTKM
ncbi:unnamed protein product [Dimorphilus gyrociliatus]|uniref:Major facilitator superfamily (MFS) profile domain-containing protein n=1 Tax=Dimorphilus gyrociliatus TaxID=2664684 RepID=A0A7I8VN86_9ANNE|nr:unnamed protein product [Dimorphilus gyrociliatus]